MSGNAADNLRMSSLNVQHFGAARGIEWMYLCEKQRSRVIEQAGNDGAAFDQPDFGKQRLGSTETI